MVKIRLHGGFFVARLLPLKCCRRFTHSAICLQYPFGAGNRNTLLPRFIAFSGFITVKSQRCAFPFDNMQPLRCNSKRIISCFFPLQQKISTQRRRVRNLCNRWVFFVNLAKLQCRCGKILFAMFAVQERKTTNFCTTSAVYAICATVGCFLSIWQNCDAGAQKFCLRCLPCNREKPQISTQRQSCTQFVQPLGVFCVNLLKLQCRCAKILFAMFAV